MLYICWKLVIAQVGIIRAKNIKIPSIRNNLGKRYLRSTAIELLRLRRYWIAGDQKHDKYKLFFHPLTLLSAGQLLPREVAFVKAISSPCQGSRPPVSCSDIQLNV
jgi:hypothetical protein